ncbi:ATP-binding protein [Streptomyces sp. NEAU-sy36]|uniref:ATP-binding protein n=1 Tax=unclassified Streptomyces TaxID=2593676 RepID=UPI0015D6253F|nr:MULTISPECIES: ATP-binding protein [unclassified Streptomyces]QLJ05549.1 ATP-binding protein [Streptomyces sp. NEAU-sy36]
MNPQISTPLQELVQRLSATPRGARLARRLTAASLASWGYPYESGPNETAQLLVSELATNAVAHGRVPGRDFELRLTLLPGADALRIEVSDARGERRLQMLRGAPQDEHGRGLILVEALSREWGVTERVVGKTVWAEIPLWPGDGKRGGPGTP